MESLEESLLASTAASADGICSGLCVPRALYHQGGLLGAEVRDATQEVDTELRHLQDAMRENDRRTTATKLQVTTINGALNGLLRRAAEVRHYSVQHHRCWQARCAWKVKSYDVSVVKCS